MNLKKDKETNKSSQVTVTGANLVFFNFTTLFILFQIVLVIIIVLINVFHGSYHAEIFFKENTYLIIFITEYILVLLPVLVYSFFKRFNFKQVFRLKSPGVLPSILIVFMSLPSYFIALMFNSVAIYFLQYFGEIPVQPIPSPQNLPQLLIGTFFVAITPGICEEILHRGLLLTAYERRGTVRAIVITSIFFGLFHFDITNLLGPVFLGLIIGYYVIRTNSIFAGILAHFLNNFIAELFQYFSRAEVQPEKITIMAQDLIPIVLYGVIGIILLSGLMLVFKKVTKDKYDYKPPISSIKKDIISTITHWPIALIVLLYIFMAIFYIKAL